MSNKECGANVQRNAQVEYVTSNFSLHKFTAVISGRKMAFQAIKMTESLLIFINDKDDMQLSDMYVAQMNVINNRPRPIGAQLLGTYMSEMSKDIGLKLTEKLNKTVYVSCNVEEDRTLLPLIIKRIHEEIKENPNMFD